MVLDRLTQRVRRSGPNPTLGDAGPWGPFWDTHSVTGATVTDESALSLTAYFRGVKLIAETIAGMPIHVFHEGDDGVAEPIKTPDTAYLWRRPNLEMTKQSMWERLVADEVRGNAFIWVDDDANGKPTELWWVPRRLLRVGRTSDGRKVYQGPEGLPMIDFRDGGEIVHIPNWGDSLIGYDPIMVARQALSLGLSSEEYAARFFSQDGTPGGVITTEQPLTKEESDKVAEAWAKRQAGTRNARRVAVLSHGSKFQQITLDPEKTQMQELRQFQGEEIARLLGIPPHLLGFTEKVTSWGAGIAEQSRGFFVFTLQAHINRFEQAINDALLVRELTDRYVKFDVDGILRGTPLQRAQVHALGINGGWLTRNDVRRDEDLPPLDGGDELTAASNLLPLKDLGSNFAEATPPA